MAHGQANMPNVAESIEFIRQASYLLSQLGLALDKLKADKKQQGDK
jgi:hypothetical protein